MSVLFQLLSRYSLPGFQSLPSSVVNEISLSDDVRNCYVISFSVRGFTVFMKSKFSI